LRLQAEKILKVFIRHWQKQLNTSRKSDFFHQEKMQLQGHAMA
jgi:hypothetical protein